MVGVEPWLVEALAPMAAREFAKLRSLLARRRGRESDTSSVASVADAKRLVELAEVTLQQAVAWERAKGTSWEAIGRALGVTRSTAHGKFSASVPADTSGDEAATARRDLGETWAKVFDLAEGVVRPATNSASHLDQQSSRALAKMAERIARSTDSPPAARLNAARLVAALDPAVGERALRALAEYQLPQPADSEAAIARESFSLRSATLDLLLSIEPTWAEISGTDSEDLDRVIMTFWRILGDRQLVDPDFSWATFKLAKALKARYSIRGNPEDLDQAIALLEKVTSELVGDWDEVMSIELARGLSLLERFRLTGDSADLSLAQGRIRGAIDRYELRADTVPPTEVVIQVWEAMSSICVYSSQWSAAEESLTKAVEARVALDGFLHPNAIANRAQLAALYVNRHAFLEAASLAKESADQATEVLGTSHWLTRSARTFLIALLLERGGGAETERRVFLELDALAQAHSQSSATDIDLRASALQRRRSRCGDTQDHV
jgi:hypothetical protein